MYKTNTKQREWERYTSSCRSSSLNKGEGNHERLWGDRWSCFIILHQRKQTLFLLFYHCKVLKRTQLRSTQNHPNNTANITQNRQYHLHSSSSSAQFNYTHSLSTSVGRERENKQVRMQCKCKCKCKCMPTQWKIKLVITRFTIILCHVYVIAGRDKMHRGWCSQEGDGH